MAIDMKTVIRKIFAFAVIVGCIVLFCGILATMFNQVPIGEIIRIVLTAFIYITGLSLLAVVLSWAFNQIVS